MLTFGAAESIVFPSYLFRSRGKNTYQRGGSTIRITGLLASASRTSRMKYISLSRSMASPILFRSNCREN